MWKERLSKEEGGAQIYIDKGVELIRGNAFKRNVCRDTSVVYQNIDPAQKRRRFGGECLYFFKASKIGLKSMAAHTATQCDVNDFIGTRMTMGKVNRHIRSLPGEFSGDSPTYTRSGAGHKGFFTQQHPRFCHNRATSISP